MNLAMKLLGYFFLALVLTILAMVADFRVFYFFFGLMPAYYLTDAARFSVLILEVILPFAVMYVISRGVLWTQVKPVLAATLLGCVIGGLLNVTVTLIFGQDFGYFIVGIEGVSQFLKALEISAGFVTEAFLRVLLPSLGGILFAYYVHHPDTTTQTQKT